MSLVQNKKTKLFNKMQYSVSKQVYGHILRKSDGLKYFKNEII